MKTANNIIRVILFFILYEFSYAQQNDSLLNVKGNAQSVEGQKKFYMGLCPGFTYEEVGFSRFGLRLGGTVLYSFGNDFFSLSLNRLYVLDLSDEKVYGKSRFRRLELNYGKSFAFSSRHPVFKHIHLTGTAGISYNSIYFYKNDLDLMREMLSHADKPGASFSISLSTGFNTNIYCGIEYKQHALPGLNSYGEFGCNLMLRIL